MNFEKVVELSDPVRGYSGVICVDSTTLGPAMGGCRLWDYQSEMDLRVDAMRLARGMSYKNALAGLPLGGGKTVLQKPKGNFDRQALFQMLAQGLEELQGQYITAEDVGTSVQDMSYLRTLTSHVCGLSAKSGRAGGDPSPWTALGVFLSMRQAAMSVFGSGLAGMTVSVQGCGSVGRELCHLLHEDGAKLVVSDLHYESVKKIAQMYGAEIVDTNEILSVDADIFAPCVLGSVINHSTISKFRTPLICGAANNQVSDNLPIEMLSENKITLCPDYVVNARGIINVFCEYSNKNSLEARDMID